MERTRPVEILLVEDEEADIDIILHSLKATKFLNNLNYVMDGEEALDYLQQRGKYSTATRPDLILLDLNLPRKSGREVLEEVKLDAALKRIPIVIMTSSNSEADIIQSYDAHANCYIRKPVNIVEIEKVVKSIESFWFAIVTTPPH